MLQNSTCHTLFALLDYPLAASEEYRISFAKGLGTTQKESIFSVAFRGFEQLKDVKLSAMMKG